MYNDVGATSLPGYGGGYGYYRTRNYQNCPRGREAGTAYPAGKGRWHGGDRPDPRAAPSPGCTQAALAELLHADKAAIARRTKNLEAKGYLVRKASPNDRRSQLLYPTEKAESMKSSKAEIEAEFYEYLTSALPADEAAAFAATLHKLYTASKTESRAGFPHFKQATEGEAEHAE